MIKIILLILLPILSFGQKHKFSHNYGMLLRTNSKYTELTLEYNNILPYVEFNSRLGVNNKTEVLWEAKFNLYYEKGNWRFNLSPTPFNFSSKWIPEPDSRIYRRYQRTPTDFLIQRRLGKKIQLGVFYRLFDIPMIELEYMFVTKNKK